MSAYTQQQETEIVHDAMTLTTAILIGNEELRKQKAAQFHPMPAAPFRQVLEIPQIPMRLPSPPKSDDTYFKYLRRTLGANSKSIVKFIVLCFFTCNIYMWVYLFSSYKEYSALQKQRNQELAQNESHIQAVEEAKRKHLEEQQRVKDETAQKQLEIDAKYQSDLEHYETTVVPNYNRDLAQWKDSQQKKIAMLEDDIRIHEETLAELYDTTKLISLTYRELWILRWLYDDMRSSDHDIRYATELLDRDRQRYATMLSGRMVTDAVNSMHSSMIDGFHCVYEAIEAGNAELARMRREQNLANVVGIAQRHHLNQFVKTQNQMLDEHFNPKK